MKRCETMFLDIPDNLLFPGNKGKNCIGNGEHKNKYGVLIDCCCENCNYFLCCYEDNVDCSNCEEINCRNYHNN